MRIIVWAGKARSVQRLATGLKVRGSNLGGGEVFRTCPDRPWGPPNLLYNGYRVFPGGKGRPGREADPSPPSSAVVMKGQSYTSTPPMGRTACTEPQCLYMGDLYLYLLPRNPQYLIRLVNEKIKGSFKYSKCSWTWQFERKFGHVTSFYSCCFELSLCFMLPESINLIVQRCK